MLEIFNFRNQYIAPAEFEFDESGSSYRAPEFVSYSIDDLYPIILKETSLWDSNLNILKKTKSEVAVRLAMLDNYIINSLKIVHLIKIFYSFKESNHFIVRTKEGMAQLS
jgi:hypothetical protein